MTMTLSSAVRIVAKIFAWLVAGVVGLIVIGYGVLWYVHRPLHEPSFFVQLTIDLVVNGESVRIERKVECKTYKIGGRDLSQFGTRPQTHYAPSIGALGTRLGDGSAVMMWTPYRCWQEEYQDSDGETRLRARPNAPDYLPLIAWTPDADDPRVLEVYPFASYFERPDARIQVKKIEVTDLSVTEADPPDEFEWFTHTREREELGSGANFSPVHVHRGQAVTMLSEEDWRGKSPELDLELDSYDHPQFISRKVLENGIQARFEAERIFDDIYWGNWESLIPSQPRGAPKIKYQKGQNRGPLRRNRDGARALGPEIIMLQWMGDALVLQPTDTSGHLVLEVPRKGQRLSPVQSSIIYRGVRLDPDPVHPSPIFYDPDTKVIFRIVSMGLGAEARRGDPIIEWKKSAWKEN
jgi:hypothetical protein